MIEKNHVLQLASTIVYSGVGMGVFFLGFALFDKWTPFDLHKELMEDHNVAIGIVIGSMMIGLGIIIAAAIAG
jgi:uncharacterized membrane protein YjfL (UPF0719 family)